MADEATAGATGGQASAPSSSSQGSPLAAPSAPPPASSSAPSSPPSSPTPPPTAAAALSQAATRPDWVGESYWDTEKSTIKPEFGQHYRDLATFKATEDSRRLTLPQKPDDYKAELPKTFKAPQGLEFKFQDNNPLLPQARQLMHDIDTGKVSGQDAFARILELHASDKITQQQQLQTAIAAEIQKLGATATPRVTAVQNWLNAQIGEQAARNVMQMIVTADLVQSFERIMANARGQGTSFTPAGGEPPPDTTRVSDEAWGKMGPGERLDYARKFPQDQFHTNGAGR